MLRTAWLVAGKDLRVEWRSRVLVWQVVPFAIIALVLVGLVVGPNASETRRVAPGLFYLVLLLVTILMIGRSQLIESPPGTRASVRMLGLDPAGVFLGKAAALLVELFVAAVVLIAGVVVTLRAPLGGTLAATPSILLALGSLAAAGTMYGALVGGARDHATLLPIVALPPFAAILVMGEKAMSSAISGGALAKWMILLGAGCVAYVAVGVLLYGVSEESE
jgi:heme exporter protein B